MAQREAKLHRGTTRSLTAILAVLPVVVLFSLAGPVFAGDGTSPDTFSLAALVDVLARPGAARTALALLGAIGVFRWKSRRRRGAEL